MKDEERLRHWDWHLLFEPRTNRKRKKKKQVAALSRNSFAIQAPGGGVGRYNQRIALGRTRKSPHVFIAYFSV